MPWYARREMTLNGEKVHGPSPDNPLGTLIPDAEKLPTFRALKGSNFIVFHEGDPPKVEAPKVDPPAPPPEEKPPAPPPEEKPLAPPPEEKPPAESDGAKDKSPAAKKEPAEKAPQRSSKKKTVKKTGGRGRKAGSKTK